MFLKSYRTIAYKNVICRPNIYPCITVGFKFTCEVNDKIFFNIGTLMTKKSTISKSMPMLFEILNNTNFHEINCSHVLVAHRPVQITVSNADSRWSTTGFETGACSAISFFLGGGQKRDKALFTHTHFSGMHTVQT